MKNQAAHPEMRRDINTSTRFLSISIPCKSIGNCFESKRRKKGAQRGLPEEGKLVLTFVQNKHAVRVNLQVEIVAHIGLQLGGIDL